MKLITAFLLHHANRSVKDFCWGQYAADFYRVKDSILRKNGKPDGYDIQHIAGKKCNSCGGKGYHPRYSNYPPYKIYDWADCWHCSGGWYRMPQWNCLQRYQFGSYVFHRPLKREYGVENPWTKEGMGFEVSDRPVMQGYVEHKSTWIGRYALALIMVGTPDFKLIVKRIVKEWRWYLERQIGRVTRLFKKRQKVVCYPYQNDPDSDLPF